MRIDRHRPILCFLCDAVSTTPPNALWGMGDDAWSQVDLFQVRGKALSAGALEQLSLAWVERLSDLEPRVIVNDRLDVALAVSADGAHLGQQDLPIDRAREIAPEGFLLGASAHGRGELSRAQRVGADYAGLGAFYPTSTKSDAVRLDVARERLTERIPDLKIPVLAIGGVTAERIEDVFRVYAVTGVAVGSAIQSAPDPGKAIREVRHTLDAAWRERERRGER